MDITIGRNIRKIRKELNLTVEDMAKHLECSISFLTLVEKGQRGISKEKIVKLTNLLNVSLSSIMLSVDDNKLFIGDITYCKLLLEYNQMSQNAKEVLLSMATIINQSFKGKTFVE